MANELRNCSSDICLLVLALLSDGKISIIDSNSIIQLVVRLKRNPKNYEQSYLQFVADNIIQNSNLRRKNQDLVDVFKREASREIL